MYVSISFVCMQVFPFLCSLFGHGNGTPDSSCVCMSVKSNDLVRRRAARWFLFKPKIPIWVNFGGPFGKRENVDIFYGHS
jgi:hypothetical protein